MDVARMKLVGVFLGLVAFGGVLGATFSGYGGFANAATPGYSNTQAAVTTAASSADDTKEANAKGSETQPAVSKEELLHYAELFQQNFASQLGVDQAKLDSALQGALGATIDQAVTDGKLSAAEADAIRTKIGNMSFKDMVGIPLGMSGKIEGKDELGDSQAFMDAASKAFDAGAQLLGISRDEFEMALRDGTMTSVMTAKNVTVETLLNTMADVLRTELNKAVANGKLTQDQADMMYDGFKGKIGMVLSGSTSNK
jgi:uncharacterized protein YidB (DUF937 family)